MTNPTLWNQLLVWPIVNILVVLYKAFEFLHVPGPLGFAVIGLTIFIRLLLYPLMKAQLVSAKKMAKLKPHMDALTAKHKDNKQALQQAQMAMYKENGVNPAAGCLPLLIQMPVLIALYNVFYQVLNNGNVAKELAAINAVLYHPALKISDFNLSFFGANLAVKPAQWQTHGWWLLSIPVITALLQWYQSRLMMQGANNPTNITNPTNPPDGGPNPTDKKTKEIAKQKEDKPQDTAMEMQRQMAIITPIMFGYFALQFPVGLALYWNVFGLFGIMQQLAVNREK